MGSEYHHKNVASYELVFQSKQNNVKDLLCLIAKKKKNGTQIFYTYLLH